MSTERTWQSLAVGEFIANCNWLGVSPQILSEVGEVSGSVQQLQQALQAWETKTTKEFFALNNWDGRLLVSITDTDTLSDLPNLVLALSLSNQQFWQCFAWVEPRDNTPKMIQPPAMPVSEPVAEFTLDNLSELF